MAGEQLRNFIFLLLLFVFFFPLFHVFLSIRFVEDFKVQQL